MRISIDADPFPTDAQALPWDRRGHWPASWVSFANPPAKPFAAAYRLRFTLDAPIRARVHVTADERYDLWLDGQRVGFGSERGDANHWFFETYDLDLAEGEHTLAARVWSVGEEAPYAQHTMAHGFLLCPSTEGLVDTLATGKASWEAKVLPGVAWREKLSAWGTGLKSEFDGAAYPWGVESGAGDDWQPVLTTEPAANKSVNDDRLGHKLVPGRLPEPFQGRWRSGTIRHVAATPAPTAEVAVRLADHLPDEAPGWQALWSEGTALTIPAATTRRVILDLDGYVCGVPVLRTRGGPGSAVRVHWAESLVDDPRKSDRGDRNATEGKFFTALWHAKDGVGDLFRPGGGPEESYRPFWWSAGRYIEILVTTDGEPLTLEELGVEEWRYPFEPEASFESSDPRIAEVWPIMVRAWQMCSHETYMDCPFYEQLQYVGDTRLQVLVTYALTQDDRLARKALEMFDVSREVSGLTYSRYPSRIRQIIPPFSMWFVAMVHDFALYRGDQAFVRSRMGGVRAVLDHLIGLVDGRGLLAAPDGWNFVDWVGAWGAGVPKDGGNGFSGILAAHLALVLRQAAELEDWLGEPELAARYRRVAALVAEGINALFWSEARGLYADDLDQTSYSEHMQCLAWLAEVVPADRRGRVEQGLLTGDDLHRTTIYFSHYLFETLARLGRTDRILDRMSLWFDHVQMGLKTTLESPEPGRSDCHAWGAHPIYHAFASFLGVRPLDFGFAKVAVTPRLGGLRWAKGTVPTPHGFIEVAAWADGRLEVRLPEGVVREEAR